MRPRSGLNLMILVIILALSPALLVSTTQVSGDKNYQSLAQWAKAMTQPGSDQFYFASLPKKPVAYRTTQVYKDADLKQVSKKISPDTSLRIVQLKTNHQGTPIFKFQDGTYAKASQALFYDDQLLAESPLKQDKEFWTKPGVAVYKSPYQAGMAPQKTSLTAYKKVKASKKALTYHGSYLYVEGQGWIAQKNLTAKDNRMQAVQELLEKKYNKPGKISVFVKRMATGETAGINADQQMYSASVTKLPLLYYTQKKLDEHQLKNSESLVYKPAVNEFEGAYKPEGSGDLPKKADQKSYTVETLMKKVAQKSDNVGTNMLAYYVAHQYDKDFHETIKEAIGQDWNMSERKLSAKTAGLMMEAIYYQDGQVLDYLSATDYDQERISKDITVKVSHKIGDAYDYRHDVAIIYSQSPFILSIFTNQASYEDISAIADDVYGILK